MGGYIINEYEYSFKINLFINKFIHAYSII